MLLLAGAITFGLIAWATPSTYTAVVNDDLARQVDALVEQLARTDSCGHAGPLLDEFVRTSGADVMLVGPDGQTADTGAQLTVQAVSRRSDCQVTVHHLRGQAISETDEVTATGQDHRRKAIRWPSPCPSRPPSPPRCALPTSTESYTLYVTPRLEAENLAVRALVQMAPWLLLALLVFSLLCAFDLLPIYHPAHRAA